jgi:glutamate/tyrosine decarboxylase-like PLP-dependent enzyme
MKDPMFQLDKELAEAIFRYCRERLEMDAPLDFGSHADSPPPSLEGLITAGGRDAIDTLQFFTDELAHRVVSIDSPGFLAFIPNAPTMNSRLFDMVVAASALNGTSWLESAGAVVAENQALAFLAERAGLPAGSGGAFVSGGTAGNLSALTVGRDVGHVRHPELAMHEVRFAVSADAHSSIGKALHVLGIKALLVEPDDHCFTLASLERALAADPHPETVVGIVATSGTTNAGIIDDLEGLGAYARAHDLWFHVDGAYGGAALFSEQRELLSGIRHADSFIVDPHKWLFAPLDCCALLYRNPVMARKFLAQQASYLDVLHTADAEDLTEWNPSDFGLHLSRRARGLPFWFSLVTNGVSAYETATQAAITKAQYAAASIEAREGFELVRPVSLSIVLYRRQGWGAEEYNAWSDRLLREQVAFVTPTKWEGETVARFAFLHPDTSYELIDAVLDSMTV